MTQMQRVDWIVFGSLSLLVLSGVLTWFGVLYVIAKMAGL